MAQQHPTDYKEKTAIFGFDCSKKCNVLRYIKSRRFLGDSFIPSLCRPHLASMTNVLSTNATFLRLGYGK